jgi:AcrR family transcriptional regulator
MPDRVNHGRRASRVADTEEKILRAATELFLRHGYTATTLAAVAAHADVAARTVYVRFGTKAALLKRAVDVAFAGDTAAVAVRDRDWFTLAGTAPSAGERLGALARGSRQMAERAGDLLAVALQAAAVEPDLAAAADAGRRATRENIALFWTRMAEDGLLPAGLDPAWLTDTAAVLVQAETYLLGRAMNGWDPDGYERWLTASLTHLIDRAPT